MNAFRVKVPRRERSTTRFPVSRALLFVRAVAKRRQQYMQARPLSAETSVIRSSGTVMTVEGNMRLDRFGEDRRDPRRRRTIAFMQARHRDLGGLRTRLQRKGAGSDTDDTRFEEVRLGHGSDEAGEQWGASLGGAGGAKGRAEGELETPKQAPCTGMGSPVTCGGSGTASCYTSCLPSPSNGGAACLSGHVRICAGGAGQPAFLPQ